MLKIKERGSEKQRHYREAFHVNFTHTPEKQLLLK